MVFNFYCFFGGLKIKKKMIIKENRTLIFLRSSYPDIPGMQ